MRGAMLASAVLDRVTLPHPSALIGGGGRDRIIGVAELVAACDPGDAANVFAESSRRSSAGPGGSGAAVTRAGPGGSSPGGAGPEARGDGVAAVPEPPAPGAPAPLPHGRPSGKTARHARLVMRTLSRTYRDQGANEAAGLFYVLGMEVARRTGNPLERTWLTFLWVIAGYGERPGRFALFCLAVIVTFAGLFMAARISDASGRVIAKPSYFADALYFSATTFATVGLGDIVPGSPTAQMLACLESIIGSLALGIFVIILSRQMDR
jgi:hypothetical protein